MLTKPKTTGAGKVVRFKRRKQKRNPRRPLEAVQPDWDRWDEAAELLGINWSEFARRAQNAYWEQTYVHQQRQLSEKGASENASSSSKKKAASSRGRKG